MPVRGRLREDRAPKLEVTQDGGKDAENSLHNVIDALIFGAALTIFGEFRSISKSIESIPPLRWLDSLGR